ncbi:MAG: NAD-glutamate dehydrogenase, partial [Actinobacteria bacterium]
LVAAFDHRDILIDPDPDPALSFAERKRLAELPRSSWQDYDRDALSPGGGVYSRAAKRVALSPQAMRVLGTDQSELTPNQLIATILKAPVDLLWNGGIGTYVKGGADSNDSVQDRANDAVRVNGGDVRARVVGEGGNLGFTQAGRIEYDRAGGRIFTDFIDNSGGVHCSDREVNLKILLGMAIERGLLDPADRDGIVTMVAPNVVAAVVYDNFLQAQILAQEAARSAGRIDAYEDLMQALEEDDLLDRSIEWLPSAEEMAERSRAGQGMARPELAVLLAYAKRSLSASLLASDLPDWDHFDDDLEQYFPGPVVDRFGSLVAEHPLRRELVATIVANQVINSLGVTFVSRLEAETGATAADVVRAYRVARAVTAASDRWATIESLDGKVPADVQRELLEGVDKLVELVARWYLGRPKGETLTKDIEAFAVAFGELADELHLIGPEDWRAVREEQCHALVGRGIPEYLARRHAYQIELVHAPDIIDVAAQTGRHVHDVARVFFRVGQAFRIDWLESQVGALPARTRWERWSVQTLDDELLSLRRVLVERVLAEGEGRTADEAVDLFLLA